MAEIRARRNASQNLPLSQKCYHGKDKTRCKTCIELIKVYQEWLAGQSQAGTNLQNQNSDDAGSLINSTCLVCLEKKTIDHFFNAEKNDTMDICRTCLVERQAADKAADEHEMTMKDTDVRPFGFLDETIYCFQCQEHLPVASFPPGVGPNDVAICIACQETIDHTPTQPCAGGCGRHARVPRTGGPAVCESCKDTHGQSPAP